MYCWQAQRHGILRNARSESSHSEGVPQPKLMIFFNKTTPYTLGGALSASPVATIIYIGEKVFRWSSPTTHPTDDEALANIMIYWFTQNITSSFWLY